MSKEYKPKLGTEYQSQDDKKNMAAENSANPSIRIIKRAAKEILSPQMAVLCLGAGEAIEEERIIDGIGAQMANATLVDKSFAPIKEERKETLEQQGATFIEANFFKFVDDEPDQQYDAILAMSVEYVFLYREEELSEEYLQEYQRFFSNLFRIMKPGGILYASPMPSLFSTLATEAGFATHPLQGVLLKPKQ